MAQEPWEILKRAGHQVTGLPENLEEFGENLPAQENEAAKTAQQEKQLAERDQLRSQRLLEALENELKDLAKNNLVKSLQEKIASGETVYLENYPQLTAEEREILQKQIEAVVLQKKQAGTQTQPLVEPAAKKGRRLFDFGGKTQARRQQTQTERPLPPSG